MGATGVLGRLLGTARSRFVFVVGKGGVGKTTTAGALALALADTGRTTHLLSTDPAHSLGDLFGRALAPGIVEPSGCVSALTLEELDAAGDATRWIAEAAPAVAELLDLGTYLDREDASALLERTFPAMDEVMAALRLADLAVREDVEHVVVDTAPTGHTLRLLDTGDVLRGWSRALAAMAAKASAVASPFAGRQVRFAGEAVMEDLRVRVERFSTEVLLRADFVVVTRTGEVVRAETERLIGWLCERGLEPAAIVGIGSEPDATIDGAVRLAAPLLRDPRGCEGLRSWGRAAAPGPTFQAVAETRPAATPDAMDLLRGRRLLLFAGKGGVGKSTCAAACAVALARDRSVLLLSTDPAGSLGDVLGSPVTAEGTRFGPRLLARQIDARARLESFRLHYKDRVAEAFRSLGLHGGADLDRQVLESIIGLSPPGIDEVFALQALMEEADGCDVLVIDSAPTGHFLRLVRMPERALSWTRALLRVLLKYRAVLGLDDFADDVLQLARSLTVLVDLLRDPDRTGVVVTTVSETLPSLETERLITALGLEATIPLAVLENRVDAARPRASDRSSSSPLPGAARRIMAPLVDPSPSGPDALLDFASRWTTA